MNKKNKLVYGVGTNDADYPVHEVKNRKIVSRCPYYQRWLSMLSRCYYLPYKKHKPTYDGVTVCKEWYSFMKFRSWMVEQDWEGKQLDKDLLIKGNKVYSPDTCIFVDAIVNMFIVDTAASRGEWPLGVCWRDDIKKFRSQCNNPFTKKKERLGHFRCPNQAHLTWKKRKHELACQLADMQIDERVSEALRSRYS